MFERKEVDKFPKKRLEITGYLSITGFPIIVLRDNLKNEETNYVSNNWVKLFSKNSTPQENLQKIIELQHLKLLELYPNADDCSAYWDDSIDINRLLLHFY